MFGHQRSNPNLTVFGDEPVARSDKYQTRTGYAFDALSFVQSRRLR